MTTAPSTPEPRDYRDTLFLPKTDFPMRAGLPKAEPKWIEFWNEQKLYQTLREQSEGRESYTLHDGPPYANGHIHMGTALNKILKDLINRSHQMLGLNANYVPGWDCHGLPIEWKVEEEFRAKGKSKDDVKPSEFRARCREYAKQWVDVQSDEFQRLGVVGDWENPYLTMRFESEAVICGELLKIAQSGQLYRGSKPIMWSPVEQTALAEAEVEYADRKVSQIYVRFPVRKDTPNIVVVGDGADISPTIAKQNALNEKDYSVVIWTTTPWTIPANRAVSYSQSIRYGLYEIEELEDVEFTLGQNIGDKLIVADDLWETVSKSSFIRSGKRLFEINAADLGQMVLDHPLRKGDDFNFPVPMLKGDHVTADAGTGFVHTAPSHGEDDYMVWMSNGDKLVSLGIDPAVPMTLDDKGCYTDVMPERFQGLDVIRTSGKKRGQDGKANGEVIKALVESGNLLARAPMTLRDAHSWRSKAPVIRRATPQWFISMSKEGLRDKALAEIDKTQFWPDRGRNRIGAMVRDRPDWLISRQRNWGVPITLIVGPNGELHTERSDADAINARILEAVYHQGVDGWFETPLDDLMPDNNAGWTKVTDILDVWFDSGCTHAFCLKQRDDLPDRADLYMEGSDQHRGWFQSSLMESCAVYSEAPYKGILTHGFVVDAKGLKMSKSLGNVMAPEDLIKKFGADIVRLWVASSDVTEEIRISDEVIKTNTDSYRKLRNTLRYMIGALDGYDDSEEVAYDDMPALERWVLHRLHELGSEHEALVRDHDHRTIFSKLFNFCTNDLSAFYFDIRKDALYCDPLDSTRRRACLTVMNALFERLTTWLAPILCFTMEEVWQARRPGTSVHLETFRDCPESWKDAALFAQMAKVRTARELVNETIEPLRREKVIKSSLEADVTVPDAGLDDALFALGIVIANDYAIPAEPTDTLADYLIVSSAALGDAMSVADLKETDAKKCLRSWKYFYGDGEITPRDAVAVEALDAQ
ncbi:isoleucine--tRNA ligase [Algimonas arctica]|uniref:Isoleucine--tRNA ligase n=1 Tax=Algimonas arctica TaxID=1479486 RepID=A0A8J3CS76_9PROT|nr:isoleucine--tRNA ligase [Algimonas arctica]GHA93457.1 isoleucine--tRNA ligase [Algimonas arctica]